MTTGNTDNDGFAKTTGELLIDIFDLHAVKHGRDANDLNVDAPVAAQTETTAVPKQSSGTQSDIQLFFAMQGL